VSTENPRDIDLVARISRGDATALALVYDRHSAAAYGLAYHILCDAGVATAVVEEVFLSVWRQPPTGLAAQGMRQDSERKWAVVRVSLRCYQLDGAYAACSTAHTSPHRS